MFARDLTGRVLRRTLPVAVVIPAVLGWLCLRGLHAGWYGASLGITLFVCAAIVASVGLVRYTAAVIARSDREAAVAVERLAMILESMPDATVVVDAARIIRYTNKQVTTVLGYPAHELVGRSAEVLVPAALRDRYLNREFVPEDPHPVADPDLTARHHDGHEVPVEVSLGPIGTGPDAWTLAAIRDVTDKRAAQDQLRAAEERYRHLAEHDPLTGLWNRRRFEEELDAQLALCRRGEAAGALLSVDLDHFKVVNDTYGHHAGDRLLVGISAAMRRSLGPSDAIARQGGDEFLVLLRSGDARAAARTADALMAAIRRTADLLAEQVGPDVAAVTASAGAVVFDQLAPTELTSEAVLIRADHELYTAKGSGRDRASISVPATGRPA